MKEIIFTIASSEVPVIAMAPAEIVFENGEKATLPVMKYTGSQEEIEKIILDTIRKFYASV